MAESKRKNNSKKLSITIKDFSKEYTEQVFNILKENFKNPWDKEDIKKCKIAKVALEEDLLIGYICANYVLDEAEIFMVAVKKEYQGKGVGSLLLKTLISELKELKIKKVFLEVNSKNEKAIYFYEKFGFVKIDLRKNYYNGLDDAIIMKLMIK